MTADQHVDLLRIEWHAGGRERLIDRLPADCPHAGYHGSYARYSEPHSMADCPFAVTPDPLQQIREALVGLIEAAGTPNALHDVRPAIRRGQKALALLDRGGVETEEPLDAASRVAGVAGPSPRGNAEPAPVLQQIREADGFCPNCGHYMPQTIDGTARIHECERVGPLDGLPPIVCVCPKCWRVARHRYGCWGDEAHPHEHVYMCPTYELPERLRLLPDGHAAVHESVIEAVIDCYERLVPFAESCSEYIEIRASLAGGRGNENEQT